MLSWFFGNFARTMLGKLLVISRTLPWKPSLLLEFLTQATFTLKKVLKLVFNCLILDRIPLIK